MKSGHTESMGVEREGRKKEGVGNLNGLVVYHSEERGWIRCVRLCFFYLFYGSRLQCKARPGQALIQGNKM